MYYYLFKHISENTVTPEYSVFNTRVSREQDTHINQCATVPFTQTVITSYAFLYITHFDILTLSLF